MLFKFWEVSAIILETHHPGYRALRHIATGSSVKIKRLRHDNAQSPIRHIIKCHILIVVGMFK